MNRLLLFTVIVIILTSCGNMQKNDIITQTVITENNIAESGDNMKKYDFAEFSNVDLINADTDSMTDTEKEILYRQAEYCQAMTDADIDTMRSLVSEDKTFTHMSGRTQTREEYFSDIENGKLRYFTVGIDSPKITASGSTASITYTSVLNANAYGAKGIFRMSGTHWYEKRGGEWIIINELK